MSDNKKKKGPHDNSKIDSQDPNELNYASNKWGVSKETIREAVRATKSSSRKVIEEYLRNNGNIE